ncbi:MAG TPA: type II toxin-antitoxin system VapC family toxin [Candidatus Lokiarchaeia archaeon]|nr:type II toxin-antitoxin system VapC family toxin [Candidatus Lokiarchaeia archaeon]
MDRYIIDASVIVKWFIEEDESDKAEAIRVAFIKKEMELICPLLLQFEVLNALKYSGLFSKSDLMVAAESLENYPFTYQTIKGDDQAKMVEIAMDHDFSIYDSAYLSLAIKENEHIITADDKIIKKLPANLKHLVTSLSSFNGAT